LYFIAGVEKGAQRLAILQRGMGIKSEWASVLLSVMMRLIPHGDSLFSYEGSWLDWVQKEGKK
jgi:3-mercaptopyruvate sulfurtransferase SseA